MATFECGLCGRMSTDGPCHCWKHESVRVMLAAVLASGGQICVSREYMRQAETNRLLIHTDSFGDTFFTAVGKDSKCPNCEGLGGIAIAGPDKSHPAAVCQRCRGTGIIV